ncbi:MAG: TetR family transcriptional regulator [Bacteroides sp.]|nr:TetR family transcriptional regulator [Bacteroides sp.]
MEKSVEQKLIDAAREVFYEKGYNGATVRDIAKKAEVNLALLHYYFKTKDKIFEVVFQEALELLFTKLNKALVSDTHLFEKITLMVSSYISTATKHPQLASFVVHELSLNSEFMWRAIASQTGKQAVNANYKKFFKEVKAAADNGLIKETDPKVLCMDILSLSLFPFMAKNFLLNFLYPDSKSAFNSMIRNRAAYVSNLIINSIKA